MWLIIIHRFNKFFWHEIQKNICAFSHISVGNFNKKKTLITKLIKFWWFILENNKFFIHKNDVYLNVIFMDVLCLTVQWRETITDCWFLSKVGRISIYYGVQLWNDLMNRADSRKEGRALTYLQDFQTDLWWWEKDWLCLQTKLVFVLVWQIYSTSEIIAKTDLVPVLAA